MDVLLHVQKVKYGLKKQILVYSKVIQLNSIDANKLKYGINKLNNVYAFLTIHIKLLKAVPNVILHLHGQLSINDVNIHMLLQISQESVIQD